MKPNDFDSPDKITWCPGCGDFGILAALKSALAEMEIPPHQIVITGDIGCSGKEPYWLKTNSFGGLHGRAVPLAEGIKLGNPDLTVIAIGGDGGVYGEGLNHLLTAARRNVDITVLVHNNLVYGLTTGQYSPTSLSGFKTKSSPAGSQEVPLNPLNITLAAQSSFVARGFAGDLPHLITLIKTGIGHPGFALIDVLQPCPTFNREQTFAFYKERVYPLEAVGHNPKNFEQAWQKSREWPGSEKIPLGIFYQKERAVFTGKPLLQTAPPPLQELLSLI